MAGAQENQTTGGKVGEKSVWSGDGLGILVAQGACWTRLVDGRAWPCPAYARLRALSQSLVPVG